MRFHCNFLDFMSDNAPVPERYRDYFLQYDPDQWRRGSGGGSFVYRDDLGNRWSMVIIEDTGHGISLMSNMLSRSRRGEEWFTLGNAEKINVFINTKDDIMVPAGSFLDPKEAWLGVEDFLTNPTVRSPRVKWVNSGTLNWPEL